MFSGASKMDSSTYTLTWSGIDIEITYWPLKWNTISHVEIRSLSPDRAPLPITETGFKSHFFQPSATPLSEVEIITLVREWLDEEAQTTAWQQYVECSKQGELF